MKSLDNYLLFNNIKANKFDSKFPYNDVNNCKLIFTQNKIEILTKNNEKITGGNIKKNKITIYN